MLCEKGISKVNRKRLVSTLMSGHSSTANNGQAFLLKSTREFASRSNRVFQDLKQVEKQYETWQAQENQILDLNEIDDTFSEVRDEAKEVFKKPFACMSKKRKKNMIPDFIKHPEKWKKYSLADTPDLSDESNAATAIQFLEDLKRKRQKLDSSKDAMHFRKPVEETSSSESGTERIICHQSKSAKIMPECVVGRQNIKREKKERVKLVKSDNIVLHHLDDPFEEGI